MAYGKQVARNIDLLLMETNRWSRLFPAIGYSQEPPEEPSPNHRHCGKHIPVAKRQRSSEEVVAGLTHEESLDEACRCLRCDVELETNIS